MSMMLFLDLALITLALLQFKHWYIDFVNQSPEEVATKGIYGNPIGMAHSIKHGLATFAIFWVLGAGVELSLLLSVIDSTLHYHIDWIKMRFGNRNIETPVFWSQLGLDQMAHQLTYLGLVWLAFI